MMSLSCNCSSVREDIGTCYLQENDDQISKFWIFLDPSKTSKWLREVTKYKVNQLQNREKIQYYTLARAMTGSIFLGLFLCLARCLQLGFKICATFALHIAHESIVGINSLCFHLFIVMEFFFHFLLFFPQLQEKVRKIDLWFQNTYELYKFK